MWLRFAGVVSLERAQQAGYGRLDTRVRLKKFNPQLI